MSWHFLISRVRSKLTKSSYRFERLHPPPDWAKRRTLPGTPSLSSLLTSNKSFISNPSLPSAQDPLARPPLPPGTIDLKRVRNANHTNPTVSKREAEGGKGGVVDMAWHPSKQVGVLAVGGGDRRVKFFQVSHPTQSYISFPLWSSRLNLTIKTHRLMDTQIPLCSLSTSHPSLSPNSLTTPPAPPSSSLVLAPFTTRTIFLRKNACAPHATYSAPSLLARGMHPTSCPDILSPRMGVFSLSRDDAVLYPSSPTPPLAVG